MEKRKMRSILVLFLVIIHLCVCIKLCRPHYIFYFFLNRKKEPIDCHLFFTWFRVVQGTPQAYIAAGEEEWVGAVIFNERVPPRSSTLPITPPATRPHQNHPARTSLTFTTPTTDYFTNAERNSLWMPRYVGLQLLRAQPALLGQLFTNI